MVFIINLLLLDLICISVLIKLSSYNGFEKSNNAISNVINNVCEIKVDDGKTGVGTGIYIGDDKILTCNHLVASVVQKDEQVIEVKFYRGDEWHACTVLKTNEKDDLLLLIMNENDVAKDLASVSFSKKDSITLGMEVYSIGNTLGNGLSVSKGIVSCAYKKVVRSSKEMGVIQTNISIENGDSGGPVFNKEGEIVGINSFRLLDTYGNPTYASSYAVSIKEIREFLFND